jgi:hypothetical protein
LTAASVTRLAALFGVVFLVGCDAPHSQEAGKHDRAEPPPAVQTVELVASHDAVKLEGVATILNPDALLQLDADIRSANVAADFSRGQLERFNLSTLLSRQMVENAKRQAGIDASQLKLLLARLQQTWGDEAPFLSTDTRQKLIAEISSGTRAIVRFDFPDLATGQPRNVRVIPLRGGTETQVETIWPAPSGNLAMPGVSYFGLIPTSPGLKAGDRARSIADNPDAHPGVVIPNAAIVVFASQSWCYVETGAKKYERRPVALDLPVDGGYLVRTGLEPGTRVVVRGASVLLSREAQPGEGDDDDGPSGAPAAQTPPAEPKPAASAAVQPDRSTAARSDPD